VKNPVNWIVENHFGHFPNPENVQNQKVHPKVSKKVKNSCWSRMRWRLFVPVKIALHIFWTIRGQGFIFS
jgi:hypothetical protein